MTSKRKLISTTSLLALALGFATADLAASGRREDIKGPASATRKKDEGGPADAGPSSAGVAAGSAASHAAEAEDEDEYEEMAISRLVQIKELGFPVFEGEFLDSRTSALFSAQFDLWLKAVKTSFPYLPQTGDWHSFLGKPLIERVDNGAKGVGDIAKQVQAFEAQIRKGLGVASAVVASPKVKAAIASIATNAPDDIEAQAMYRGHVDARLAEVKAMVERELPGISPTAKLSLSALVLISRIDSDELGRRFALFSEFFDLYQQARPTEKLAPPQITALREAIIDSGLEMSSYRLAMGRDVVRLYLEEHPQINAKGFPRLVNLLVTYGSLFEDDADEVISLSLGQPIVTREEKDARMAQLTDELGLTFYDRSAAVLRAPAAKYNAWLATVKTSFPYLGEMNGESRQKLGDRLLRTIDGGQGNTVQDVVKFIGGFEAQVRKGLVVLPTVVAVPKVKAAIADIAINAPDNIEEQAVYRGRIDAHLVEVKAIVDGELPGISPAAKLSLGASVFNSQIDRLKREVRVFKGLSDLYQQARPAERLTPPQIAALQSAIIDGNLETNSYHLEVVSQDLRRYLEGNPQINAKGFPRLIKLIMQGGVSEDNIDEVISLSLGQPIVTREEKAARLGQLDELGLRLYVRPAEVLRAPAAKYNPWLAAVKTSFPYLGEMNGEFRRKLGNRLLRTIDGGQGNTVQDVVKFIGGFEAQVRKGLVVPPAVVAVPKVKAAIADIAINAPDNIEEQAVYRGQVDAHLAEVKAIIDGELPGISPAAKLSLACFIDSGGLERKVRAFKGLSDLYQQARPAERLTPPQIAALQSAIIDDNSETNSYRLEGVSQDLRRYLEGNPQINAKGFPRLIKLIMQGGVSEDDMDKVISLSTGQPLVTQEEKVARVAQLDQLGFGDVNLREILRAPAAKYNAWLAAVKTSFPYLGEMNEESLRKLGNRLLRTIDGGQGNTVQDVVKFIGGFEAQVRKEMSVAPAVVAVPKVKAAMAAAAINAPDDAEAQAVYFERIKVRLDEVKTALGTEFSEIIPTVKLSLSVFALNLGMSSFELRERVGTFTGYIGFYRYARPAEKLTPPQTAALQNAFIDGSFGIDLYQSYAVSQDVIRYLERNPQINAKGLPRLIKLIMQGGVSEDDMDEVISLSTGQPLVTQEEKVARVAQLDQLGFTRGQYGEYPREVFRVPAPEYKAWLAVVKKSFPYFSELNAEVRKRFSMDLLNNLAEAGAGGIPPITSLVKYFGMVDAQLLKSFPFKGALPIAMRECVLLSYESFFKEFPEDIKPVKMPSSVAEGLSMMGPIIGARLARVKALVDEAFPGEALSPSARFLLGVVGAQTPFGEMERLVEVYQTFAQKLADMVNIEAERTEQVARFQSEVIEKAVVKAVHVVPPSITESLSEQMEVTKRVVKELLGKLPGVDFEGFSDLVLAAVEQGNMIDIDKMKAEMDYYHARIDGQSSLLQVVYKELPQRADNFVAALARMDPHTRAFMADFFWCLDPYFTRIGDIKALLATYGTKPDSLDSKWLHGILDVLRENFFSQDEHQAFGDALLAQEKEIQLQVPARLAAIQGSLRDFALSSDARKAVIRQAIELDTPALMAFAMERSMGDRLSRLEGGEALGALFGNYVSHLSQGSEANLDEVASFIVDSFPDLPPQERVSFWRALLGTVKDSDSANRVHSAVGYLQNCFYRLGSDILIPGMPVFLLQRYLTWGEDRFDSTLTVIMESPMIDEARARGPEAMFSYFGRAFGVSSPHELRSRIETSLQVASVFDLDNLAVLLNGGLSVPAEELHARAAAIEPFNEKLAQGIHAVSLGTVEDLFDRIFTEAEIKAAWTALKTEWQEDQSNPAQFSDKIIAAWIAEIKKVAASQKKAKAGPAVAAASEEIVLSGNEVIAMKLAEKLTQEDYRAFLEAIRPLISLEDIPEAHLYDVLQRMFVMNTEAVTESIGKILSTLGEDLLEGIPFEKRAELLRDALPFEPEILGQKLAHLKSSFKRTKEFVAAGILRKDVSSLLQRSSAELNGLMEKAPEDMVAALTQRVIVGAGVPMTLTPAKSATGYQDTEGWRVVMGPSAKVVDVLKSEKISVTSGDKIFVPYYITVKEGALSLGVVNAKGAFYKVDGMDELTMLVPGTHTGTYVYTVPAGEKEISLVVRQEGGSQEGLDVVIHTVGMHKESTALTAVVRPQGNTALSAKITDVPEGKKVVTLALPGVAVKSGEISVSEGDTVIFNADFLLKAGAVGVVLVDGKGKPLYEGEVEAPLAAGYEELVESVPFFLRDVAYLIPAGVDKVSLGFVNNNLVGKKYEKSEFTIIHANMKNLGNLGPVPGVPEIDASGASVAGAAATRGPNLDSDDDNY